MFLSQFSRYTLSSHHQNPRCDCATHIVSINCLMIMAPSIAWLSHFMIMHQKMISLSNAHASQYSNRGKLFMASNAPIYSISISWLRILPRPPPCWEMQKKIYEPPRREFVRGNTHTGPVLTVSTCQFCNLKSSRINTLRKHWCPSQRLFIGKPNQSSIHSLYLLILQPQRSVKYHVTQQRSLALKSPEDLSRDCAFSENPEMDFEIAPGLLPVQSQKDRRAPEALGSPGPFKGACQNPSEACLRGRLLIGSPW